MARDPGDPLDVQHSLSRDTLPLLNRLNLYAKAAREFRFIARSDRGTLYWGLVTHKGMVQDFPA